MKKIRLLLTHLLLVAMITSSISPVYVYADEHPGAFGPAEETQNTEDAAEIEDTEEADEMPGTALTEEDAAEGSADEDDIFVEEEEEELLTEDGAEDGEDPDADAEDAEAEDEEYPDEWAEDYYEDSTEDDSFVLEDIDENDDGSIKKPEVTDKREITKITPPEKTEYSFEYKMILAELLKELPQSLEVWHGEERNTIEIIWKCQDNYDKELDIYHFVPDLEGYRLADDVELPVISVKYEKKRPEPVLESLEEFKEEQMNSMPDFGEPDYTSDEAAALPSTYVNSNMPKVRDQNPYGTCWAFGTIGAMEGDLIHDGKANKKINLSELHMAYYRSNYIDPKKIRKDKVTHKGTKSWLNNGGQMGSGIHVLTNLIGAVNESVAPYKNKEPMPIPSRLKNKKYAVSKDKYQLDKAYYYSTKDIAGIKGAIMNHGAVMAAYIDSEYFYSSIYNAYYNPYGFDVPYWISMLYGAGGHRITIVGWNDNFSRNNFGTYNAPEGDGAWLIRNSWGLNGYGHEGYFWMSYYDQGLIKKEIAVAIDAVKTRYKNCYSYDGQNDWDAIMTCDNNPATQKISYTVSGGEAIQAVGIEVASSNVKAEVTVRNKKTGKSSKGEVNCTKPGFYTVRLKKQLPVNSRAGVEVKIKYSSPSGKIKIYFEEKDNKAMNGLGTALTYKTVCDRGCTVDGDKVKYDPRVKVYTVKYKAPKKIKVKKIKLNKTRYTLYKGKSFTLKATVTPKNATNKKIKWTSSKTRVATVNSKGKVTAKGPGTATITAKARDGSGKKAKCKVTVKVRVKKVSLNAKTKKLKKGKTFKLKAKVKPSNATNKKIKWTSSKPKVATVSSSGLVRAKSVGTTTITAKAKDGSGKKAKCKITVTKK